MTPAPTSTPRTLILDRAVVTLPTEEWQDFTDEDGGPPPFTICRTDVPGGSLQFSLAFYVKGPRPTEANLLSLLRRWPRCIGHAEQIEAPHVFSAGPMRWATASHRDERHRDENGHDTFWRVWYGTDGYNVAYATYNCFWPYREEEREAVDAMIRSFRFEPQAIRGGRPAAPHPKHPPTIA